MDGWPPSFVLLLSCYKTSLTLTCILFPSYSAASGKKYTFFLLCCWVSVRWGLGLVGWCNITLLVCLLLYYPCCWPGQVQLNHRKILHLYLFLFSKTYFFLMPVYLPLYHRPIPQPTTKPSHPQFPCKGEQGK